MKKTLHCGLIAWISISVLAIGTSVLAQTTPVTAQSSSPSGDQIITLDEFQVNTQKADGYRATNSITATGIGVESYKVPLQIMAITSEYLKDTAALDMRDAVQYLPGITTDPRNEAAFTIRGFSGNIVYRNGFYRRQNYATWDMDRVEVIMGPAAIFFGSVRPGGIINYVTKRPEFSGNYTNVSVQGGSYNFIKGQVVQNQVLSKNLALRLSVGALSSDNNGYDHDYFRESHFGSALRWKINDNQEITLEADRDHRLNYLDERGYAGTHTGYLGNPAAITSGQSVTQWVAANYPAGSPIFNTFAPIYKSDDPYGRTFAYTTDSFEKFDDWDVDVTYRLKISDHLVWQTALSRGQDDQPGSRANNGDQTPFADGSVNMQLQYYENNRNSLIANNSLTTKFNIGPVKNTLQIGQQFQEVRTDQPGYLSPAGKFSSGNYSAVIHFTPSTSPTVSDSLGLIFANQPINDWVHKVDITQGYYIALQSSFFDDRFNLLAGGRYNVINGSVGWSTRPTNATTVGRTSAYTPQVGIIGEIIPGLSAFATFSRSVEPQNGTIDVDGNIAGPIDSTGYDAGFKTNLMDGRLSSTLTYFSLTREHIASTDVAKQIATNLSPWYIFDTTQEAGGVALDLNYATSTNNSVLVGYQHMLKAEVTDAPSSAANTIGQKLADVPDDTFSLWDRYHFTNGSVKGLSIAFGGRYSSAAAIPGTSSAVNSPTTNLTLPSFFILNMMISKDIELFGHKAALQMNINNLTDKVYRDGPEGMFGPPRKIFLSMDMRY